jgi:hypothetical protein
MMMELPHSDHAFELLGPQRQHPESLYSPSTISRAGKADLEQASRMCMSP